MMNVEDMTATITRRELVIGGASFAAIATLSLEVQGAVDLTKSRGDLINEYQGLYYAN
jgi:hypothetical protein